MRVKALKSFVGVVSMNIDEIKEINDEYIVKDLIKAKFVEVVEETKTIKEETIVVNEKDIIPEAEAEKLEQSEIQDVEAENVIIEDDKQTEEVDTTDEVEVEKTETTEEVETTDEEKKNKKNKK